MSQAATKTLPQTPPEPVEDPESPFGPNEMRLGAKQWIAFAIAIVLIFLCLPAIWQKLERFDTGPDYRIPYSLSNDYWQIGRWFKKAAEPGRIVVIGDSVIWGEYVNPDGTLPHFLSVESGAPGRFANCGVNGFFPLAIEGLIDNYGTALRNQKVILEADVLWMTSPQRDLSASKKDTFNHTRLVPQFRPRIPVYDADMNERIGAVVERNIRFLSWVSHIQITYFDQKSIPQWTLADDGQSPPNYPNLWRNPASQITMSIPDPPATDPDRGPKSPRHVPWFESGKEPLHYDWVPLDKSLQWQAFQRTLATLRSRGNDVMVLLVPFNEHMIAEDNRPAFRTITGGIDAWLAENKIPHIAPATLPPTFYADASHPLTEGYALLAKNIYAMPEFQQWLKQR
ncbi:hypothetical protein LLG95_09545 [bacterium]|nr:hypothetical protein [bacterium]